MQGGTRLVERTRPKSMLRFVATETMCPGTWILALRWSDRIAMWSRRARWCPSTARRWSPRTRVTAVKAFLAPAVAGRRWMRQYGCGQEGTKASSRRDADTARGAGGRCAPRRPRPRTRSVRGGRATRTHVSRSSRRDRSDGPRSHVTPARVRSCASCRSRAVRVSRSIVSSSPCAWDAKPGWHQGRTGMTNATTCGGPRASRSGVVTRIPRESTPSSRSW